MDYREKSVQRAFDTVRDAVREICALFEECAAANFQTTCDLHTLRTQLDQPFAIFICGEFNSGKSSLINSLAGEVVAEVGVLPTTREIQTAESRRFPGLVFVDSPGTNSISAGHEEVTSRYLERSDFVLFVTSIERPLSDSEVRFLEIVTKRWSRPIIVAVNKCDQLEDADIRKVVEFVRSGLAARLGVEPAIYPVSAKSNVGVRELENALVSLLSGREKVFAKLLAPLNTATVYLRDIAGRLHSAQERCRRELETFDQIRDRCRRRLRESDIYLEGVTAKGRALFEDLSRRIGHLIDERFGFFDILRAKVFGREQRMRGAVLDILEQMSFETRVSAVTSEAAERVMTVKALLLGDVGELVRGAALPERGLVITGAANSSIDATKIAEDLRRASEAGMNKFLALSGAAAASGIGAKIAVASTFEATAMVLMVALGAVSLRMFPREKRKVKEKIESDFRALADNFASSLSREMTAVLSDVTNSISSAYEDDETRARAEIGRLETLTTRVTASEALATDVRRQVETMLDKTFERLAENG